MLSLSGTSVFSILGVLVRFSVSLLGVLMAQTDCHRYTLLNMLRDFCLLYLLYLFPVLSARLDLLDPQYFDDLDAFQLLPQTSVII